MSVPRYVCTPQGPYPVQPDDPRIVGYESEVVVLFTDHERAVAEAVAAEREACAQVVEMQHIGAMDWDYNSSQSYGDIRHEAWQEAAAAIRARGET